MNRNGEATAPTCESSRDRVDTPAAAQAEPPRQSRRDFLRRAGLAAAALTLGRGWAAPANAAAQRPNILFCILDDWSWPHAGAYGDQVIQTPAFDRVARMGTLFNQAFVSSPSCTPSRAAILTGQQAYRLGAGVNLYGPLMKEYPVYPDLLEAAGYWIGFTGKGWAPGAIKQCGRDRNPCGPQFSELHGKPPTTGISATDYAANFVAFLQARPDGKPFCFWYGAIEPHRVYEEGSGARAGIDPARIAIPGYFPDDPVVAGDIADYYLEVQWADSHLGRMLDALEARGELDNTLIFVTGDNGMPFPRCKTNLYDCGTHVPLAVCWPAALPGGSIVDDLASLTDVAPTILEAAGLPIPAAMTGRTLMPTLKAKGSGWIDPTRDAVVTLRERHVPCREGLGPYPMRMLRTKEWIYIRNFLPDSWPVGDPRYGVVGGGGLATQPFGDCDSGPTKLFMIAHHDEPGVRDPFRMAFAKRPAEELYRVTDDPLEMKNLAGDPQYADILQQLGQRLTDYLKATGDPRIAGKDFPLIGMEGRTLVPLGDKAVEMD